MELDDIHVIEGQIPWISGLGALDDNMCPGGWEQALAESDSFGWRLSLYTSDAFIENEDGSKSFVSKTGKNEFVIADYENAPVFDIRDIKTPDHTNSTFNKTFKKYFGEFDKVEEESIIPQFEKAKILLKKGQKEEAYTIIRNVGLSLYYKDEHLRYAEKAKAHFAGVDFEHFMASDYAAVKNDANVTAEDIIKYMENYDFGEGEKFTYAEIVEKINQVEDKISAITPTIDKYRIKGEKNTAEYTKERGDLHVAILEELIYNNLEKYIPQEGEAPTFILLGGRGGSGKSKFKNLAYNDNFVVLDADIIKEKLPEYKGWNAAEVHEESSDILEQALVLCRRFGLNVVVDATMNSSKSVERRLQMFKDRGYQTEAHYMYLPPQKSAQRAVTRFLQGGETGRYVPIDVVLSNKTNEQNFDTIKKYVDAWSFYNGDVEWGENPYLLASSGKGMSYMEKRRSKYMFDFSDRNVIQLMPNNQAYKKLEAKIETKLKTIKQGARVC